MLAQLRYKYGDKIRNYGIGFFIAFVIEGILGLFFPSSNPFDNNAVAIYWIGWVPITYLTIKTIKGLNEGWLTIHHFSPFFWLRKRMAKKNRKKIIEEMIKSEMVSDLVKSSIKTQLKYGGGIPDSYIDAYQRKQPNYAGYYL
jgi:hypothetical protein